MTTTPTPLVTREALLAFTQRLVERYAPEKVILYSCGEACGYGSLARGEGRWDSDADVLVVMPFEGRHLAKIREMRGTPTLPGAISPGSPGPAAGGN